VSWKRVRGHEALAQSFEKIIRRGRLGHAYLFAGPPGVGKRLFADELAKAIFCENRPAEKLEACDQCDACLQVAAGTHPDLFIVQRPEDKLEVPIDSMRELCKNFSLKSARGRGKIIIVDDADDLNEESANCFLKTLEEPPPKSLLLLIGTSPDRQLPTILSRCQVVHFAPLSEPLLRELLQSRGVEDRDLVDRLARLSGGSLGNALALADPALWEFRRAFLEGLSRPPCDSVGLAQAFFHFVEEAGKESAAQRGRASLTLRLLIDFFDAGLSLSLGNAPKIVEPTDMTLLKTLVQRVDTDSWLAILDRCLEADYQIDRRVQLVLAVEAFVDVIGRILNSCSTETPAFHR
jgi:DNA polymerase-3 subunit delta'